MDTLTVLKSETIQAFDSLCFLAPDSDGASEFTPNLGATVYFQTLDRGQDGWDGALWIGLQTELAKTMTRNMLPGAELNSSMIQDGVGEMANVVCGQFLHVTRPSQTYRLESPRAETSMQTKNLRVDSSFRVKFPEGLLEVQFFLEE